jgi:hypothetical protein
LQALSEIPVAHVAKTFSQLKAEESSKRYDQAEEEGGFTTRDLDKLARLESHAILDEIGVLQDSHVENQVDWGAQGYSNGQPGGIGILQDTHVDNQVGLETKANVLVALWSRTSQTRPYYRSVFSSTTKDPPPPHPGKIAFFLAGFIGSDIKLVPGVLAPPAST